MELTANLKQSYLVTAGHSALEATGNERLLTEILTLPSDTSLITFNEGDYIKDFPAFNDFLTISLQKQKKLTITKKNGIALIKGISRQVSCHGIDHLAMKCLGTACMKYHTCVINTSGGTVPVGESCPIESSEILQHLKGFAADFEDLPSYADKVMVHNVVQCEIIKSRILSDMSTSPTVTVEVAKGIDRKGNAVMEKVANPNQKALSDICRMQERLMKCLSMTLEQKRREQGNKKRKTDSDIMALYQQRLREFEQTKGIRPIIDITSPAVQSHPVSQGVSNENSTVQGSANRRTSGESSPNGLPDSTNIGDKQPSIRPLGSTQEELRRLSGIAKTSTNKKSRTDDFSELDQSGGIQVSGDAFNGLGDLDLEIVP